MASKYIMSLNKKYVVTTFGLTYVNKLVEVIGIINYDEAKTLSDVHVTALNEKIVDSDYEEYFQDVQFYKCKIVGTTDIIILWSDIIDGSKTSLVGEKFNYKFTLQLGTSTETVSKDMILDEITALVATHNATVTFIPVSTDNNTVIDILQERLDEAENIIRSLQSLSTIVPMIDSIISGDIEGKLDTISTNISTINERVETLVAGL